MGIKVGSERKPSGELSLEILNRDLFADRFPPQDSNVCYTVSDGIVRKFEFAPRPCETLLLLGCDNSGPFTFGLCGREAGSAVQFGGTCPLGLFAVSLTASLQTQVF